jgi:tetratricopeptide (TPR) repeat protein
MAVGLPPPPPSGRGQSNPTIFGMPPVALEEDLLAPDSGPPATVLHDRMVDLEGGPDLELGLHEADLPAPADLDLPAPIEDLDLPVPADLDLPAPRDDLLAPRDDLLAPLDDLPSPADILPAPVDLLPAPADILPAPAENLLAPAEDLPIPLDEDEPAAGRGLAPAAPRAARPAANLVEAREGASAPARAPASTPAPATPAAAPRAPAARSPSRALIYGGLAAVVLVGGAGAAYVAGVFDPAADPTMQVPTGDAQPTIAEGEVAERGDAVLAKLDEDLPAAYQQAMALCEAAGDRVGQAEAALLLHLRYGPDPVHAEQAMALLESFADRTEPFVRRVFGLAALARGDAAAAKPELGADDPRARLYLSFLHLRQGEFDEARAAADAVLARRAGNRAADLTRALADLGRDPDAGLDALRRVATTAPDHARAQQELVEALLAQGLLAEAHQRADALQTPGAAGAGYKAALLGQRARIAAARGDRASALRLYEQAASILPDDPGFALARLEVLLRHGDHASVRKELETLVHDNPGLSRAHLLLAELGIAIGEGDRALAALDAAAPLLPGDPRVENLRGRVLAMRSKVEEAQAAFEKARTQDPLFADATVEEARLLAKLDRPADALALLDEKRAPLAELSTPPARRANAALLRAKAELLEAQDRKAEALEAIEAALVADPSDNESRLRRALLLSATGQGQESQAALIELHERTGGYPGLAGPLGRVYLRSKELDKLDALIGSQLDDPQSSDDVLLTGALLRLEQDKLDQARSLVDRVMARTSDPAPAQLVKCRLLLAAGDASGALAEIEQARPRAPSAEIELWHGQALEYNRRAKEAIAHYEKALALDPTLSEAAALLGRLLAYSGAAKRAIELLEPVVGATDEFPYAHAALGRARYDLGKHEQAIRDFRRAYELDPELFEAYYWEGRIRGDRNEHAAASKALAAGVEVAAPGDPYLPDAYRRLGDALRHQGRSAEARQAYEKYLEVAPANAAGRAAVERLIASL